VPIQVFQKGSRSMAWTQMEVISSRSEGVPGRRVKGGIVGRFLEKRVGKRVGKKYMNLRKGDKGVIENRFSYL